MSLSIGRTSKMSSNEKKTLSSTSSRNGRTVSNGGTDSSGGGSLGSVPVKIVAGPYSLREGIHTYSCPLYVMLSSDSYSFFFVQET